MIKGRGYIVGKPKKTCQGKGKHSKPKSNQKKYRGQGKK
jgi:hypothetical protein